MESSELRLHCLELAMAQAKMEGLHADRSRVAQIFEEFYALVMATKAPAEDITKAEPGKPKPKADKLPEIFK